MVGEEHKFIGYEVVEKLFYSKDHAQTLLLYDCIFPLKAMFKRQLA